MTGITDWHASDHYFNKALGRYLLLTAKAKCYLIYFNVGRQLPASVNNVTKT